MKKVLSATIGLLAISAVPAMAADLPVKARPMVPVVTAYNWTGCYIGGNAGGKWARVTNDIFIPATIGSPDRLASFASDSATTFIVGGQVGCNYQPVGTNWVFGVEGDFDWQRWNINRAITANAVPLIIGDTFEVSSRWQASARGRIGYAWDRFMLYATGGAAFTEVRTFANFPAFQGLVLFPATSGSASDTVWGPTVGLGFEYAFWNNLSFGVEGRYSWYGTKSYNNGVVAAAAVITPGAPTTFVFAPVTHTVKLETLEVMAKLNFKIF